MIKQSVSEDINQLEANKELCVADPPIFILGIMQRSGTNYLANLLDLHPDCILCGPVWEDGLLNYASHLSHYINSVYKQWNERWKVEKKLGPPELLYECLGNGLIAFLNKQKEVYEDEKSIFSDRRFKTILKKRLITKTPSVKNLKLFHKFFPKAKLLIIVRDGRSVVESGMRSFSWRYEKAIRRWAKAAEEILDVVKSESFQAGKLLIVRYEDLYQSPEDELERIFSFLDLDLSKYDFNKAKNLPVSGSSDLLTKKGSEIHWEKTEKDKDFNPLKRWEGWGRFLHERFNWIAGKYLTQLGYEQKAFEGNRIFWRIYNHLLDLKWKIETFIDLLGRGVMLIRRSSRL